jgi:hypothetical protein
MVPEGSQGVDRVVREVWKPCPCRLAPQDGPWSRGAMDGLFRVAIVAPSVTDLLS